MFETLSSGLTDMFPKLRKRKILVTACLCCLLLLLDLPYTTNVSIALCIYNTELNYLRKLLNFIWENLKLLLKEFQFVMSLKI